MRPEFPELLLGRAAFETFRSELLIAPNTNSSNPLTFMIELSPSARGLVSEAVESQHLFR